MHPDSLMRGHAGDDAGPLPPLSPTAALDDVLVAPPAESGDAADVAAVERLAIRIGALNLLLPADAGREVILPPPASSLPHTPAWLSGVANVRGTLVPVLDLALAFEVERDERARRYLLILGEAADPLGLLVDGLPVLRRFERDERLSGVPPHPPLLDGILPGAYAQGTTVWIDVDISGLLDRVGELLAAPTG
jgi:chemotaxis signal transduction protein